MSSAPGNHESLIPPTAGFSNHMAEAGANNLNLVYATTFDANNISQWSGTGYFIGQALRGQGAEIVNLWPKGEVVSMAERLKHRLYSRFTRSKHYVDLSRGVMKRQGNDVRARIPENADAIVSTGVSPVAFMRTGLPIITWADATFRVVRDYYEAFTNLSGSCARAAESGERWVAKRADALVFSSSWAAESAIRDYGADPAKVHVVSYGANFPARLSQEEALGVVNSKPQNRCRLLFVGTEWERKGGPIALETAVKLQESGIETELLVLGSAPVGSMPPNVRVLGFVSKTSTEGAAIIERAFRDSHFLLLPTRADCTPIVMSEAASFAVPVVSTVTGGVPSVVRRGVTGLLLSLAAGPQQYADAIASLMRDWSAYRQMAYAAHEEYRNRLNWDTAGRLMIEIIRGAIERRRRVNGGPVEFISALNTRRRATTNRGAKIDAFLKER
jgi:glycosyltransferase involved in cell wall biosynthesis